MKSIEKIMLFIQALLVLFIAIYSYAFVDLNLTISSNPLIFSTISHLQQLAYYQRPFSTVIFIALIVSAFSIFIYNLYLFSKNRLSKKYLFTNLILSTGVLAFAYPFLSSDIFNYMFDAKIISFYHQSPYAHKALDYPNDDWIRFMRWVHRYSPYGPLWLGLSLIPTIIGFGKFVTTLFAFKLFIGIFHITSSYLVYRITSITDKNNALLKTALYAMNPIFFIEGVINAHNDVVVACLMLTTILLALNNKKFLSYGVLLLGAFIKYVSILTLPFFMFFFNLDKNKSFKKLIYLNILTMAAFTFIFSTTGIKVPFVSTSGLQIQFQPWYLFWTLPLTVLISNLQIGILVIVLSISALLRYVPYIYNGDWSQPGTIDFMRNITVIPTITVAIIILAKKCLSKIS